LGLVQQKRQSAGDRPLALVFKGREFSAEEIGLIREVVTSCGGLSRQELASTMCELLEWRRPGGGLKWIEARELLAKLEAEGLVTLPPLVATKPRGTRTSVPRTDRGARQEAVKGTVGDVKPVVLRQVTSESERLLWRELVGRYHYLGHKVPFGAHVRYLVEASRPSRLVLGCVQLSSPAWKMAPRDQWIGWSDEVRRRNLQLIVSNSRFLLLPWVEVRNLASTVLALVSRQVADDWEGRYGVRPVLLETLVDERRFSGTCYLAANWIPLGVTQGRGRMDRACTLQGANPKRIFVYPLHRHARQRLCRVES